jgi:hypothetical protein
MRRMMPMINSFANLKIRYKPYGMTRCLCKTGNNKQCSRDVQKKQSSQKSEKKQSSQKSERKLPSRLINFQKKRGNRKKKSLK